MSAIKPADQTCELLVQDGKVFCKTHQCNHERGDWSTHESHSTKIVPVIFRHVCYTGSICTECNDGKILIDSEQ